MILANLDEFSEVMIASEPLVNDPSKLFWIRWGYGRFLMFVFFFGGFFFNEWQEFIPRGRQAVEDHPGPLVSKKQINIPSEHLLLHRLQNVNISSGDSGVEGWVMREMLTERSTAKSSEQSSAIFVTENDLYINSEEELYFKGHTAVWSKGIASEDGEVLPRICFTCDTPIKHAFFCSTNFVQTKDPDKREHKLVVEEEEPNGICLIGKNNSDFVQRHVRQYKRCFSVRLDSTSLRVYLSTGEDYLASLEFSVSNTWSTRYGILLEKNASTTTIDIHSIPMPRLFSLSHPLDEMSPVLIKSNTGSIGYLTDSDYKVIFVCAENDLVLLYDNKAGKHFVSKLRKASMQEANSVGEVSHSFVTLFCVVHLRWCFLFCFLFSCQRHHGQRIVQFNSSHSRKHIVREVWR